MSLKGTTFTYTRTNLFSMCAYNWSKPISVDIKRRVIVTQVSTLWTKMEYDENIRTSALP